MMNIEEKTLARVSKFLPDAIAKALKSYKKFCDENKPENAAEFIEFHKACKVAIGHIELLVKLARQISDTGPDPAATPDHSALAAMVEEAEAELRGYLSESAT